MRILKKLFKKSRAGWFDGAPKCFRRDQIKEKTNCHGCKYRSYCQENSMYHKISEMCDKIDVIKQKSDELREFKYETASTLITRESRIRKVEFMIVDIRALCREVGMGVDSYKDRK